MNYINSPSPAVIQGHGKALDEVFFQHGIGPNSELGTAQRLHTIAHRDDDI